MPVFRSPYYEGWVEDIIWQLADLFESAIGAPKILDARRALSRYPPVQIIYATPRVAQCRDLIDWNSVRPELVCTAKIQTCRARISELCRLMHILGAPFSESRRCLP